MALGYLAAGQAASDVNFLGRVQAYLQTAASSVLSEATSTQDHLIRVRYAQRIKQSPSAYAVQMANDVAMQAGPQTAASLAAVTDAQIQVAVDSLFTQYADAVVPR